MAGISGLLPRWFPYQGAAGVSICFTCIGLADRIIKTKEGVDDDVEKGCPDEEKMLLLEGNKNPFMEHIMMMA